MSVVALLWRTRLRSSWRAAAALVILIGLGGGVALSVAAGARRTASAFEAILEHTNAFDLAADYGAVDAPRIEALVGRVEDIAHFSLLVGFMGFPAGDERSPITVIGTWDERAPAVGRSLLAAGRFPVGSNEAMLNERAAASFGVGPGDHIDLVLGEPSFSNFEPVGLDIVGVGFGTSEIIDDERADLPVVHVSRGFTERHLRRALWGQAEIDVSPGADPGTVASELARNGIFVDENLDVDRSRVQRSLRPLLVTLAGLAGLAALATVVVAGQALLRIVRRDPADERSLRAIGAKTRQLVGADVLCGATVAMAGMIVAVGVAVATSPVFPVGPLRRSGLFGGVSTDLTVLGAGGVILALAIAGVVAIGSQRRRAGSRLASSGRVPGVLASRPAAATGLRFAIAQRGVLSTVAGVAAGISIVVACATFSGSLDRLIDDPALVGMDWDAGARSVSRFAPVDVEQVQTVVRADPAFDRVTGLRYLIGTVDGTIVPVAVVNALKGNPWPPITSGRAPVASDEVLVGRATLDELGVDVGERITISLPEDVNAFDPSNTNTVAQSYTVVGSAVAPAIGEPGQYTPKLAVGALVSIEGLGWLAAQAPPTVVLFGLADDARVSAVFDRFPDGVPFQGESTDWFTSAEPAEVSQAARARTVIWIAVGALAVAIVAAVVHTLLVSVRQRRREYAVLKAIGFTGRQVRATVLWQSGAIFGLAMAFALPVGVGVGRWLWRAFADGLGIVTDPTVPVLLLGAFVLVTAAAVQSAAMLPATIARRVVVDRWVRPE